jgi:tetratricopeptide (TPR) repeat protein
MPTNPPSTPVPAASTNPLETADRALFTGDWERALLEYQAAFDSTNDIDAQAAALLGLGRAHTASGDLAAALDYYRMVIDGYPGTASTADAYFLMARVYDDLSRFTEAADAYQNYLSRRHGYIDSYVLEWRGDSLLNAGNFSGALTDYQAALTENRLGGMIPLQIKVARTTAITGDYSTAIVMYQDIYNRAEEDATKSQVD